MQTAFNNRFYSGTSGIVVPVPQALYPHEFKGKSRLEFYASVFNSIEINSSFYRLPRASTIIKWREAVPKNFQFTFKLPKSISHAKGLNVNAEDIALFVRTIDNVDKKKGCILIQFPPSLKPESIKQLQKLLKVLDKTNTQQHWKIAAEFRNKIWYNDETFKLLQQYNCSLVLHDLPSSVTPCIALTNVLYLRFHGTEKGYRGSYNSTFLSGYAQHIRQWISEGKYVYCYFNNTLGDAFHNLQTLNGIVHA